MTKIYFLGITHIDHESQQKVTQFLKEQKPDAVCLELDKYRLESLLAQEDSFKEKDESQEKKDFNKLPTEERITSLSRQNEEPEEYSISNETDIFSSMSSILEDIGFFENELAHLTQTKIPGREMIMAYKIAKELGSEIFLIDRSIFDISRIMEEEVSEEEGQTFRKMVDDLIFGDKITLKTPSADLNDDESTKIKNNRELNTDDQLTTEEATMEEDNTIDLDEVLELFKDERSIAEILDSFNQTFPKLYSVLLTDRNSYMIDQILAIAEHYQKIVVILGYGHLQDIVNNLQIKNDKLDVEVIY